MLADALLQLVYLGFVADAVLDGESVDCGADLSPVDYLQGLRAVLLVDVNLELEHLLLLYERRRLRVARRTLRLTERLAVTSVWRCHLCARSKVKLVGYLAQLLVVNRGRVVVKLIEADLLFILHWA